MWIPGLDGISTLEGNAIRIDAFNSSMDLDKLDVAFDKTTRSGQSHWLKAKDTCL
jgi:hypothetical protein